MIDAPDRDEPRPRPAAARRDPRELRAAAAPRGPRRRPRSAHARALVEELPALARSPSRPSARTSSTTRCRRSSSSSSSARASSTARACWPAGVETLAAAEEAMLALTCERAGVEDGMDAARPRLRLGLAHARGSPSGTRAARDHRGLELAPAARVSIRARGLPNVEVVTADVERVRHRPPLRPRGLGRDVRAHAQLRGAARRGSRRGSSPAGALFVHVFSHRRYAYPYDRRLDGARRSSPAGLMPSRRPAAALPGRPAASSSAGASTASTTRAPPRPGSRTSMRNEARILGVLRAAYGPGASRRGSRTGASSSSPAPSSGATAAAASGSSRTTSSRPSDDRPAPPSMNQNGPAGPSSVSLG